MGARTTKPTTASKVRTLIVQTTGGKQFKLTVPASAKITFAAVNPQGRAFGGYALRIYEGVKQTAVFDGVQSFRDEAYPITQIVKKVQQDSHSDSRGNAQSKREVSFELVDDDFDIEGDL